MNIEKLRQLWDDHARAVYAFLLKLTRSEADARDFLQDIFHRLAKQPDRIAGLNGEARPYLLRFARNVVVDQARRNQVRDRILSSIEAQRRHEYAPAEDPDAALLRGSLARGLAQLPEGQREVVHARLWQGQTFDEIARESGLSINTVASRYRYGLDKMREQLRELYEDLNPQASANSNRKMKDDTDKPLQNLKAEEPLIRPLEQRRVPSATGAAFALPVLPIADDHEAHHDAPPAAEDGAIDEADLGDELILIDDADLAFISLPMDFNEMVKGIEWGAGEDGLSVEPHILWPTMVSGIEHSASGGVALSGITNSLASDGVNLIIEKDIEVMAGNDPQIHETPGEVHPETPADTVDHEAHAPHANGAPVAAAAPAITTASAPQISGGIPAVGSAAPNAPEIVHLDHLGLPVEASTLAAPSTAHDTINHEVVSIELHHGADASASTDQDIQLDVGAPHTGAAAATVDHWVPVEDHGAAAVTDLVTEPFIVPVESADGHDTDHAEVTADAGALSPGPSTPVRHGLMAATLVGTMLMNRDPKSRREKKGN